MRLLPLFIILLALDTYAFQAFRVLAQPWSEVARGWLYGFYWLLPALAIGMLLLSVTGALDSWNKNLVVFIRTFLIILYLSKFLVAGVLLIDDLRRGLTVVYDWVAGPEKPVDLSRSRFLTQLGLVLGGLPLVSLTYGMLRNPYRYRVHRQEMRISGLSKALAGLRIVQISDIHSGSFTQKEPVRKAIDLINGENPDLVFFTGDLVNNVATEAEPYIDVFENIKATHGVYSILGNHDYGDYVQWPNAQAKRQNREHLLGIHRRLGWDLLLNENRILTINGEKVGVIGVENYSAHPRFSKYGDLAAAYRGVEDTSLKLLLSHDPSHWEDQVVTQYPEIAATFSGHTHGMQFGIEIPGWIKWSPIQYVYKQWAGLYSRGRQYLYVNRGFGFLGYPGRVGILPEITVVTLVEG